MEVEDNVARAWATTRQMMQDRGYDVTKVLGDAEAASLAKESNTFCMDVLDGVAVVFHTLTQTIRKAELFQVAGDVSHIILILNTKTTGGGGSAKPNISTVKSLVSEAETRGVTLEIFTLKEMQFNVSRHVLVPEHTKLSGDEIKDVLASLCVKNRFQLPAIASNDPMARYLNLKHGDIVRIKRPSPTAGAAIAYRCCRRV